MQFKTSHPKGTKLGPHSRAILSYLQTHGRQSFEELHEIFKESSRFRSNGLSGHQPNPQWLRSKLGYLRDTGLVLSELEEGVTYYAANQPRPSVETTAQPCRTQVMHAAVYSPPHPPSLRAGSMDFANCPSIEGGRPRAYTPGKVIHG